MKFLVLALMAVSVFQSTSYATTSDWVTCEDVGPIKNISISISSVPQGSRFKGIYYSISFLVKSEKPSPTNFNGFEPVAGLAVVSHRNARKMGKAGRYSLKFEMNYMSGALSPLAKNKTAEVILNGKTPDSSMFAGQLAYAGEQHPLSCNILE